MRVLATHLADGTPIVVFLSVQESKVVVSFPRDTSRSGRYQYNENGTVTIDGEEVKL